MQLAATSRVKYNKKEKKSYNNQYLQFRWRIVEKLRPKVVLEGLGNYQTESRDKFFKKNWFVFVQSKSWLSAAGELLAVSLVG